MSETITIRRARPGDAPGIAKVGVETWRNAYAGLVPNDYLLRLSEARQAVQWDALVRRSRGADAVLVAESSGPRGRQIVGYGSCGRSRGGLMAGEVFTLYIGNDWQALGIGQRLLFGLFKSLAGRNLGDAVIWVLSGNPARFFYEAMGGTRVAERQERFAGALLDETAYGWSDLNAWLAERSRRV